MRRRDMSVDQLHELFMLDVKMIPGGCWEWQGEITAAGYGRFFVDGAHGLPRRVMSHRWMYVRAKGAIMPGLVVDHVCMNKKCCNPAHLEAVTPRENNIRYYRSTDLCKAGKHLMVPENVYEWRGKENCRECRRVSSLARSATHYAPSSKPRGKTAKLITESGE